MDNRFNFFVPLNDEALEKAAKAPLAQRYSNMELEGMASDDSKDIEGEVLEPNGYVIDHFLKNGYVNYEHLAKKSPKFLIGEPIAAHVKDNQFFIKTRLWENSEVARDAWDKILAMKASGTKRKPGWSIEGKALARDPMNPKHITKALITNVALTFSPVNSNSWAEICKGRQKEDFVEPEYPKDGSDREFVLEFDRNGKKYRVGKDFLIYEVIAKSMDVAATKPLAPESLDKKSKDIALSEIKKALDNVLGNKEFVARNPGIHRRLGKIIAKIL